MPFADNQGTRIYWDEQGTGAPILLIMGLGYPSAMWHRTAAGAVSFLPHDRTRQSRRRTERCASRPLLDCSHGFGRSRRARRRRRSQCPCLWGVDGRHDRPGIRVAVSRTGAVSHSRLHSRRRTERQARRARRNRDAESPHLDEPGTSSRGRNPFYLRRRDAAALDR